MLPRYSRKWTLAALAGAMAAAAGASPARAADFTLTLTGPPTAVVGQPVVMQATGTHPPPDQWWYLSWLYVDLFRPSAVPTCPPNSGAANQMALGTGGAVLALAVREDGDATGAFSIPVGFTPLVTGPLLLCAYSANEEGGTWVNASMTIDVKAAAPVSVAPPRVVRAGTRLVCRRGTWSNAPTRFAYRWKVDGAGRAGGAKLRVTRGLRGHSVQCSVTASNPGGSATAASRRLRVR